MDSAKDLLAKLISIPSVNPMGRDVSGPEYFETALTDFLEGWLSPLGLDVRRQPVSAGRENLLATFRSPGATRHVLLEVHQDTVPVEGMVIEPFRPVVDGTKMYGRGACDNKGPMTAMLMALRRLATEKPKGAADVTLALTVDEEHTFTGVGELVRQGLDATCAIVAEPTGLNIVVAHKGVVRWEIATKGRACHSSAPERGESAIYAMAPVLSGIEEYAAALAERPADAMLGGPTISVGRIEGGVCVNMVPDSCRIEIDRRLAPGEDPREVPKDLDRFLRERVSSGDFESREPWLSAPPMGSDANGPLSEAFGASIDEFRPGHDRFAVPFGTDAAAIAAAGVPSIVFGPGDVAKAHTEDEWVPLDEVELAAEIYHDFCTSGVAAQRVS